MGVSSNPNCAPDPALAAVGFSGGGEVFITRPIRPADAPAHAAFFHRLAPEDVRFRVFAPLRELTTEQLDRLTDIDTETAMAYIAVRRNGETVAVARLQRIAAPGVAELAVVVQPDAKRKRLATELVRRLFEWARARGITRIVAAILADNTAMLAFARKLGFQLRHSTQGGEVVEAELDLTLPGPVATPAVG
jgi:acetyltransferase